MTVEEACGQAFENGRKVGDAEGYARGKAEVYAEAGDLISIKAARKTCQHIFSDPALIHAVDTTLKNTPVVAAEPVKHGRWINPYSNRYGHPCHCCSECGYKASYQEKKYCANCGADMRGGNDG